jgi:hypothetical protein
MTAEDGTGNLSRNVSKQLTTYATNISENQRPHLFSVTALVITTRCGWLTCCLMRDTRAGVGAHTHKHPHTHAHTRARARKQVRRCTYLTFFCPRLSLGTFPLYPITNRPTRRSWLGKSFLTSIPLSVSCFYLLPSSRLRSSLTIIRLPVAINFALFPRSC